MTLEEILVITIGIFLVIALLVMRWCERNTYVLGIGWAIKRKIHCWRKYKMQKEEPPPGVGARKRQCQINDKCNIAQKRRKINDRNQNQATGA